LAQQAPGTHEFQGVDNVAVGTLLIDVESLGDFGRDGLGRPTFGTPAPDDARRAIELMDLVRHRVQDQKFIA
jgi:hypothetical protein